jgi:hypothetical protein
MASLEPDRDQIEIFVDAIFRHAGDEGYVSLRTFLNNNKVLKPIQAVKLNGASLVYLIDVAEDQARRAANNPEPAVFCPPLAVFNGATGWQAREEDLFKGLTISVECDERPDEARTALEEILGPATTIVRSGGQWIDPDGAAHDKLHIHWRLAAPAMNGALDKLKRARKLATAIVGGDASNVPAVHCLRWPGGWHRKGTPRLCELVSVNPDVEIDLEAALAALEATAPPEPTKPNGGDGGEQSNPEDWSILVADIVAGRKLHLSINRLAAKYIRSGMSAGAAVNHLRGLMDISQAKQERPGEWQARYDDIPRAVESASKKFPPKPEPKPEDDEQIGLLKASDVEMQKNRLALVESSCARQIDNAVWPERTRQEQHRHRFCCSCKPWRRVAGWRRSAARQRHHPQFRRRHCRHYRAPSRRRRG